MIIAPGFHQEFQFLKNSGSKAMNVNGSSTPQVFSYSPTGEGDYSVVVGLTCLMSDNGSSPFNNFGSIAALTNGVLLETTISGDTRQIFNIKDNIDLVHMFPQNHFGNSTINSIGNFVGFGESPDTFFGFLPLERPYILNGNDLIQATVRDNLTAVDVLSIGLMIIVPTN